MAWNKDVPNTKQFRELYAVLTGDTLPDSPPPPVVPREFQGQWVDRDGWRMFVESSGSVTNDDKTKPWIDRMGNIDTFWFNEPMNGPEVRASPVFVMDGFLMCGRRYFSRPGLDELRLRAWLAKKGL